MRFDVVRLLKAAAIKVPRCGQPDELPRRISRTTRLQIEQAESRVVLTTTTIVPVDGTATDTGIDGTFETINTTGPTIESHVFYSASPPTEDRGLFDFSPASLSAGTQINSATLNLTCDLSQAPLNSNVVVDVEGYVDDGSLAASDASASATLLGKIIIPSGADGLTTYSVSLDPSFVQSILGQGKVLGLITRIDPNSPGVQAGFYSANDIYAPVNQRPNLVLDVTSNVPSTLTVSTNVSSVAENASGPVTGTVVRTSADLSQPVFVTLTSSDPNTATVPATLMIPAGQTSVSFAVTPVDDTILEGTRTVSITATADGYSQGSSSLNVTDYETLSLSLSASSVAENAGAGAVTGTITRNNTNIDQPLTLNLSSSNTSQATAPATVTIAAGQSSATFAIDAVDDHVVDGPHSVIISATAAGYAGPAQSTLQVTDADGGQIHPGNLLVSRQGYVDEYTGAGLQIQRFIVPYPSTTNAADQNRDLIVDENGQIQLYNGTFLPTLTTIDPATGNATQEAIPGWSTINNVSYGGIATFHQYAYLTDMSTAGAGDPEGIVRVDLTDGSWQRYATTQQFQDLTVGLDGQLYALDGNNPSLVREFNPITMALERNITLPTYDFRGIAVAAKGDIFAVDWNGGLSHLDSNGNLINKLSTGYSNLSDIDLRSDGTIALGGRFGDVVLTDTSLGAMTHFTDGSSPVFVSFADPTVFPAPTVDTSPGTLAYIENAAPTAIDPGVLVTTDGAMLTGATVAITSGLHSNQDVLGFTAQNGITGTYFAANGELVLSGTASAADYQAVLRSVTYQNTSDNPDSTPRSIAFTVHYSTYSASASRTVNVTPVNDPPVITADQSFSVDENAANGAVVGTVAATDVDSPLSSLQSYSIVSGNANGAFAINASTGQITVADSTQLDWESTPSFTLGVTVSDGQMTSSVGTLTINVNNINDDAPVVADRTFSVNENATIGTVVGVVTATDADSPLSALQNYTIVSGNASGAFAIDPATGVLTVADGTQLDWETTQTFTLGVIVSDGKNTSAVATMTVNVNNVNDDAPVVTTGQSFNVDENAANGTAVGTMQATDVDSPASALSYSIVSGNTNGAFAINSATGQITVADSTQLDFETTPSFTLGVTAFDGKNTSTIGTLTISVNNLNDDAPVITAGQSFSVNENAASGTVLGTVLATDVDSPASALQSFSIVSGNTNGALAINATTGQITVANGAQLDAEAGPITLGVTVSDGRNTSAVGTVVVNVADVITPPSIANQSFTLLEKSPNGTVVGTVPATNYDLDDALVYSITSGNTGGAFTINSATGQITVANASQLNYLVLPTYQLTVHVADAGSPTQASSATISVHLVFQPAIDVDVGDSTNTIDLNRDSTVSVAILSTANFNATSRVNVGSLTFGHDGTEASLQLDHKGRPQYSYQDVNHDGRLDLVVTFVVSRTGLQVGDTQAVMKGTLTDGTAFESFATVNVIASSKHGKGGPNH